MIKCRHPETSEHQAVKIKSYTTNTPTRLQETQQLKKQYGFMHLFSGSVALSSVPIHECCQSASIILLYLQSISSPLLYPPLVDK